MAEIIFAAKLLDKAAAKHYTTHMNAAQEYIEAVMLDLQNEINDYMMSDIPLENMQYDLDYKIEQVKRELMLYFAA